MMDKSLASGVAEKPWKLGQLAIFFEQPPAIAWK
jgi:hypothetical protein